MKFSEALVEVRRKMGMISPFNKSDLYWFMDKVVRENKDVFDRLAKA